MNWKTAVPLLAGVALALFFMIGGGENTDTTVSPTEEVVTTTTGGTETATQGATVPASGNVDDLVGELTLEADATVNAYAAPSDDLATLESDRDALTQLTTAYDEGTF